MASRNGNNYGLTVLCPITPGREAELRRYLADMPVGKHSPLARLPMVHLARWTVIDSLPKVIGMTEDRLKSKYLLFLADLDGARDDFLDAMVLTIPDVVEAIWGCCDAFPGTDHPVDFRRYIDRCEVETTFFYAGYPNRTVEEVLRALAVQREFVAFAAKTAGSSPGELRRSFGEFMDRVSGMPVPPPGTV